MICTQPKLHCNHVWFYDHKAKKQKVNHFEFGIGNDEFPIHSNKESADMNSFQCLNLPGLAHIPEFSFMQAIFIDKENSPTAWRFLREINEHCKKKKTVRHWDHLCWVSRWLVHTTFNHTFEWNPNVLTWVYKQRRLESSSLVQWVHFCMHVLQLSLVQVLSRKATASKQWSERRNLSTMSNRVSDFL